MMANMECWLGSFVIFQGIPTSIAKKPYSLAIFRGGGKDPPVPIQIPACLWWLHYIAICLSVICDMGIS